MFIKPDNKIDEELLSRRFYSEESKNISFVKRDRDRKLIENYSVDIVKSEIFLFGEQIGLFSLTLKIDDNNHSISFISNIINQCRNFDSEINRNSADEVFGPRWHEWISENWDTDGSFMAFYNHDINLIPRKSTETIALEKHKAELQEELTEIENKLKEK
jgi:hypothetical protein